MTKLSQLNLKTSKLFKSREISDSKEQSVFPGLEPFLKIRIMLLTIVEEAVKA